MNFKIRRRDCSQISQKEDNYIVKKKAPCYKEGEMHKTMVEIYKHWFRGGTFDQIMKDNIKILILNPTFKSGIVKRKSYGSLYERTIIYLDSNTGYVELKRPDSWGGLDLREVQEKISELDKESLV